MKRSLMQVYVKNSVDAVALYQRAFGATLGSHVKHEDGSYYHSELELPGQIIAVAEQTGVDEAVTGNVMQFCLEFDNDERDQLQKAYDVLKEGATISVPLGPCDYSEAMTDLTDKFGVRWCLFV